jgi:hypothetical protein
MARRQRGSKTNDDSVRPFTRAVQVANNTYRRATPNSASSVIEPWVKRSRRGPSFKLPPVPAKVLRLTITRNQKEAILSFDLKGMGLRPQKRAKPKAQHTRHEDITLEFANKVIVDHVSLSLDTRELVVFGREHFLSIAQSQLRPTKIELAGYFERGAARDKILYRYYCFDQHPPGGIHWVMNGWHRFFAVDTNTQIVVARAPVRPTVFRTTAGHDRERFFWKN